MMDFSRFEAGIRKKERVGFLLSALLTGLFFVLVLVMAFRPAWLGAGFFGLVLTLAFILLTFVLMGGYVFWRLNRLDEERRELAALQGSLEEGS